MTLLALSRGDPSGIGLEVACKAWLARGTWTCGDADRRPGDRAGGGVPPFLLVDDIDHCRRQAASLGLTLPFAEATPETARACFTTALPVLSLGFPTRGRPGHPDPADAPGTIRAIERCVELVAANQASAVVTLPVSKAVLHRVGYPHPGQTEFMGELARRLFATADGRVDAPVMLLWSPELAVVPVTIHEPLAAVPRLVTVELIVATARVVARDMAGRFGVSNPRLAVSGLNPHAGEGGDIGGEEIAVVAPAIERLRAEGIDATGPHPADTLFHAAARARYDVALTMYHDQALIPIKTVAFDTAVNCTLGLPFVRTSPDHGTAFDIAGQGCADPASLVAALRLAADLAVRGG